MSSWVQDVKSEFLGLNAPSQRRHTTSGQEQGGTGRGFGSQATSKGQHTVVVRQTKPATHSKAILGGRLRSRMGHIRATPSS